jgi:uncharacterized membrane protein
MRREPITAERRERLIAGLLWYGTWAACAVIGIGMTAGLLGYGGLDVQRTGIALFILLPIGRVALMLAMFVRERDYTYAAISAVVLAIIAAGVIAAR